MSHCFLPVLWRLVDFHFNARELLLSEASFYIITGADCAGEEIYSTTKTQNEDTKGANYFGV
jgi:hypothetical protein